MHKDRKLQGGALFAIGNLVHCHNLNAPARQAKLKDIGILARLEELLSNTLRDSHFHEEYV